MKVRQLYNVFFRLRRTRVERATTLEGNDRTGVGRRIIGT